LGVNVFILDRRRVKLSIAGHLVEVGMLRRFWKITELDDERSAELTRAEAVARNQPSPPAAIVADVLEFPCPSPGVRAHLVIGWEAGRSKVTDMGWDYLPTIGFAVRNPASDGYVLHEERGEELVPVTADRARLTRLIASDGSIALPGPPTINSCRSVALRYPGYAEADCIFSDGRHEMLLVAVRDGGLPSPEWFVGKRPSEAESYPA
jgi:hypothetical protein